jgi:hypothetical protein
MKNRPNYLVHAPAWDPDSGGAIFLHQLVHTLRQLGEDARIWPWYRDPDPGIGTVFRSLMRKPSLLLGYGRRFLNPELDTPIASFADLRENTIVVYPEIRLGNPLGAANVVRWLLYRPGLKDPYSFTAGEMFFRVGEMCDIPEITGGAPDLELWRRHPAYRNQGRTDRQGACYLLRKGHEKPRISQTDDAICIDGKRHEEIAAIFNACHTFYSYDEASLYSQFAALCGCLSVIVPGLYPSREEWVADHEIGRFGVAYGLDDIDHAQSTMHRVDEMLREKEDAGVAMVRNFIRLTQERFG